jgi:ABC-type lipoprotein export system ATPase subunit
MQITIIGGIGKDKKSESLKKVILKSGQIVSIVGPTGSGKTQLINDINCRADKNTPTKRKVIFSEFNGDIAFVSQHNSFLSDLPVGKFLEIHAKVRKKDQKTVVETINFANKLTGEKITSDMIMTELSGGQTRSLLIADALVISNSSIVLLDEIENAGINKTKVLDLLEKNEKILVFVSHDPRIILMSDKRIIMKGGAMQDIINTSKQEKKIYQDIIVSDDITNNLRDKLRCGQRLS